MLGCVKVTVIEVEVDVLWFVYLFAVINSAVSQTPFPFTSRLFFSFTEKGGERTFFFQLLCEF